MGNLPLSSNEKIITLAQMGAEVMASYQKIISNKSKVFDEVIGSSEQEIGMYSVKILFDNAYTRNKGINRLSPTKTDFERLLSKNQRFIANGIANKFKAV
uniref:Phage protein n=1 Tax=Strongyloides venezuelensis TaxID=75913 RepID=A0A0K0FIX4_STRVS